VPERAAAPPLSGDDDEERVVLGERVSDVVELGHVREPELEPIVSRGDRLIALELEGDPALAPDPVRLAEARLRLPARERGPARRIVESHVSDREPAWLE